MTGRVTFVLGIHDHQPIGNFENVFEEAYERSYRPFLDVLERHPHVKVSMHHTGPLIEWIEAKRPDYFDRVRALVEAGRVEVVGGAFYEPILASISEDDAVAQIERMGDWAERRLGVRPAGMWVAERVWSANLPRPLARAGIRYVCLDTNHFERSGVAEKDLDGAYVTEFEGHTVTVFPISKSLRYAIPFEPVENAMKILAAARDASRANGRPPVLVMADDGEKFGVWPGTYEHCFEKGWLDRFFAALEDASGWLRCATFAEALAAVPPKGRIYLPETSYAEMAEWAPGGLWRNFLVKYPEANRMQKKAVRISRKIARMRPGRSRAAAERALHRAQCNCGYWHGVFGGLYLNFLRGANWQNLIEAERWADAARRPFARCETADIDADGRDEVVIETDALTAAIAPHRGGALEEFSVRALGVNLLDTLARRPEAYHEKVREAARGGGQGTSAHATSIHEIVTLKEPNLDKYLEYDEVERLALQDRFLDPAEDLRALPYEVVAAGPAPASSRRRGAKGPVARGGVEVRLARAARPGGADLRIEKTVRFRPGAAAVEAAYRVENHGVAEAAATFAVEWSWGLQAPEAADRWIEVDGRRPLDSRPCARATDEGARGVAAVDGWRKFRATLTWDVPATLRREPIETVSNSEAGFERSYQGTTLAPRWDLRIPPGGAWTVSMTLKVERLQ